MAKIDSDEICPCGSGRIFKDCHEPKIRRPVTPEITQNISLKVIPEPDPESRSVFIYDGEGTIVFRGFEAGLALCCGKCKSYLVTGLKRNQIQNVVIKCKACGSYNET